ncbi:MAG: S9 family peptidase [Bulleidia sp.]|nr:S9 family peptidase [Bulleidia sp.]
MKKVELEDIAEISCPGSLKLSPSGKTGCFVVKKPLKKENSYAFDLYEKDGSSARQLTHDGTVVSYDYDEEDVLLVQRRVKEKEDVSCFFRLPLAGGEAAPAFEVKEDVQSFQKISTGLYAMVILKDWNALPASASKEEKEEEKDYHIFEEVPFWGNGRGYVSGKRSVLYLYDEKKGALKRITGKYTDVGYLAVKGSLIACVCASWKDVMSLTSELHVYDAKNGKDTTVVKPGKYKIGKCAFLGEDLVYTASDMKPWGTGQLFDFWKAEKRGRGYKCTLLHENKEELSEGDTPLTDIIGLGGKSFVSTGKTLYFTAMHAYHTDLYSLDLKGEVKQVIDFKDGVITGFDTKDGKNFLVTGAEPAKTVAVYAYAKKLTPLFDPNDAYLKEHFISRPEYISVDSPAGGRLDGWVMKPYGYKPKKKYPGVLEIHGGPRCAYGVIFYHEMQMLASAGYFVFFCNPHGSEGYGEAFADLRGKYGTIDYADLMAFTDGVLDAYPQIDAKHLGASGGSYGGFMCNWIESHTDRFAAIASQRSVSNWVADFGASEIGVSFDSNEMAATPWTDMEKMWAQSPLKDADKAKTPILFIHSLCDYNCTIDQGVEMFTAMKYHHVPSRMVVFEGENHSLSRSGKPKHRIRRLKEIRNWFDHYLGGSHGKISD